MTAETTPPPAAAPDITSSDKLWAALAYIFPIIIQVILLFLPDKRNRPFVKAHSTQALILGILFWGLSILLTPFAALGCILAVATTILVIYYAVKAYRGEYVDIPVITNFCKNQGWA